MLDLTMPTLQKLLTVHPELITRFGTSVKIENAPYMALCVENIGLGPRSQTALSVAHYGEQNGDLMCDPEMCFELEIGEQPRTWVDEAVGLLFSFGELSRSPSPRASAHRQGVSPLLLSQRLRRHGAVFRGLSRPRRRQQTHLHYRPPDDEGPTRVCPHMGPESSRSGLRGCFREEPGTEPQIAREPR